MHRQLVLCEPSKVGIPEGGRRAKKRPRSALRTIFVFRSAPRPGNGGRFGLILFLNTSAGIAIISQEAPHF